MQRQERFSGGATEEARHGARDGARDGSYAGSCRDYHAGSYAGSYAGSCRDYYAVAQMGSSSSCVFSFVFGLPDIQPDQQLPHVDVVRHPPRTG